MSKWKSTCSMEQSIADTCGVYVIKLEGNPIYVGASTNIRKRIFGRYGHWQYTSFKDDSVSDVCKWKFPFGEFQSRTCRDITFKAKRTSSVDDAFALEKKLIRRLRPIGNKMNNPDWTKVVGK